MRKILADKALTGEGWQENIAVEIADDGTIASVGPFDPSVRESVNFTRVGALLPAISNLHSHTFQRAMAGMTEYRSESRDSFWSWRKLMYQFLDRLKPEHVQAIAAQAFMEMLESGYAAVGEFHYVHHQRGGKVYDELTELSGQVIAAASETSIGLTLLPVLYSYGGAGEAELTGGQLRFGNDLGRFVTLVDGAGKLIKSQLDAHARIGVAPHSLRATSPAQLAETAEKFSDVPFHIHIAEQTREVDDIESWLGKRPVAWLLDNMPVGPRWCLIHATHMTEAETIVMAKSGAVAGLCPITEANLGDGIFNGADFIEAGGRFGIGTDSNVQVSLSGELRQLEYSQRLRHRARNVLLVDQGSLGESLYLRAAAGGAQAIDRDSGNLQVGKLADLVAIDLDDDRLCGLAANQIVDGWMFAADDRVVSDVWSAGRHCVQGGRHVKREAIAAQYRLAIADLVASL